MYAALESSGEVMRPDDDLIDALFIDQMAQRYTWSFVKEALGIDEIDVVLLADLKGIIKGEFKKAKMDRLRGLIK